MALFISLLIIIFAAVIMAIFLYKIIFYIYSYFFWGAIYVSTSDEKVEKMIGFLDLKKIKKAADLGAGDGRFVIALAKEGIEAHGYEINPFLVLLARKNIKKAGLENKAFMHLKNLWQTDTRDFDVVFLYAMKHMMKKLEKKLNKELKPGASIVSNYFVFPNWKPEKSEESITLYVKN